MAYEFKESDLTAYALGELDEEATEAVEAELKKNEEARTFVSEVQKTAAVLKEELRHEPEERLLEEQIEEIEQRFERRSRAPQLEVARREDSGQRKPHWRRRVIGISSAVGVAAVVVVAFLVVGSMRLSTPMNYVGVEKEEVDPTPVAEVQSKRAPSSKLSSSGMHGQIGNLKLAKQKNGVFEYRGGALRGTANDEGPLFRAVPLRGTEDGEDTRELPIANEEYAAVAPAAFVDVAEKPLSTFSIDVDTAAYSNVRRFLNQGRLPPRNAVRIEEMINYFEYDLPEPEGDHPIAIHADVTDVPWQTDHLLARVALKGIDPKEKPPANLVFLIDVSGSMGSNNKLPLLKEGMKLLVNNLRSTDRVAIVTYAGKAGTALDSTLGSRRKRIIQAIDRLRPGGSTHGSAGIELAYQQATKHFIKGGINRVILSTDGDLNVGVTSNTALTALIKEKAKSGVFLSVLGFGTGNYKDARLEQLADNGNGHYAYIDSFKEAQSVLVDRLAGTLMVIAKDVKVQIELNPAKIERYRLIGYENRKLAAHEFNDDKKDAGEMGAGHAVTALYELVPSRGDRKVDPLKYQTPSARAQSGELFTVKVRYKRPDGEESILIARPVHDQKGHLAKGRSDLKLAAAVAGFGMLLRDSPHKGSATFASIRALAEAGLGKNPDEPRREFLKLIDRAAALVNGPATKLGSSKGKLGQMEIHWSVTSGNLSPIAVALHSVEDDLRLCYEEGLLRSSEGREMKVQINWALAVPRGRNGVRLIAPTNSEVEQCILSRLERLQPPVASPTVASIELRFRPL